MSISKRAWLRSGSIFLSGILLTLGGANTAKAHSQLISSNPSKNQVVFKIPSRVSIVFNENLLHLGEKQVSKISVVNSSNARVDVGGSIVGGARITTKVKPGLAPGRYVVSYRVVSEDGHPVEGSYSFTLKSK